MNQSPRFLLRPSNAVFRVVFAETVGYVIPPSFLLSGVLSVFFGCLPTAAHSTPEKPLQALHAHLSSTQLLFSPSV